MKQTTIKELKKGEFFTLRDYGEQEITSHPVWIRGEYDKGSKTFSCFKFDDINREAFFKGAKVVYAEPYF